MSVYAEHQENNKNCKQEKESSSGSSLICDYNC